MSNLSNYYAYHADERNSRRFKKELKEINERINNKTFTSKDLDRRDILKERIKDIKDTWGF